MRKCATAVFVFSVGLAVTLACSSSGTAEGQCAVGSEGCACTAGGSCDTGLTCLSKICVDQGGSSGAASTTATSATAGATSGDGSGGAAATTATTGGGPATGGGGAGGSRRAHR